MVAVTLDGLASRRDATVIDVTLPGVAIDATALTLAIEAGGAAAPITAEARYEFVGKLGAGGMGEVLAARDRSLRRVVAYKRLLPEAAANASVLGRFLTEAQITSQLDHPNVVPIYGLEVTEGGSLAYAMKMIEGVELADVLRDAAASEQAGEVPKGHDLAARLEIFVKVCDAMSFAHSRGVLHRDLKPGNVMVGRYGQVYVVDWGIARLMGEPGLAQDAGTASDATDTIDTITTDTAPGDATRTRVGQALGTPSYMSPEQARGHNAALDARSDIFTLGLILQEVVTLQRARAGGSIAEALLAAAHGMRKPIVAGRRVAPELCAIIAKATEPDVAARYPDVDALAADVRRHLRGDAVSARPDSFIQAAGRWVAKHRMWALLIGVVVPLVGAIVGMVAHEAHVAAIDATNTRLNAVLSEVAVRATQLDAELYRYEGVAHEAAGVFAGLANADPSVGADHPTLARHLARLSDPRGAVPHIAGLVARGVAEPGPGWSVIGSDTRFALRHTRPVTAADGKPLGVVAIDIAKEAVHDDLDLPAGDAVVETLLTRPDGSVAGRVVHDTSALDLDVVLRPLAPELRAAASGVHPLVVAGRDLLVAWRRVEAIGWSYVVVIDRERLASGEALR